MWRTKSNPDQLANINLLRFYILDLQSRSDIYLCASTWLIRAHLHDHHGLRPILILWGRPPYAFSYLRVWHFPIFQSPHVSCRKERGFPTPQLHSIQWSWLCGTWDVPPVSDFFLFIAFVQRFVKDDLDRLKASHAITTSSKAYCLLVKAHLIVRLIVLGEPSVATQAFLA